MGDILNPSEGSEPLEGFLFIKSERLKKIEILLDFLIVLCYICIIIKLYNTIIGRYTVENDVSSQFVEIMSRFVQKIMAIDRAEKYCYGVTLSQAYLIDLLHRKNILSMNELSQEMGLATSTLTRVVDVLVRDEIVCRNASEQDRRKVCTCLTDKGKDLAKKLQACSEQFWSKIFFALPDEIKRQVPGNLAAILQVIEDESQSCCSKN